MAARDDGLYMLLMNIEEQTCSYINFRKEILDLFQERDFGPVRRGGKTVHSLAQIFTLWELVVATKNF
jgi:hypothetical protein